MRRYIRALLLCTVFAVFSGLYVYSKLFNTDVSAGGHGARRAFIPQRGTGGRRGSAVRAGPQKPHWYNRYIMRQSGQIEGERSGVRRRPEATMHLAVVACGERLEETLTMIKSAVLFSVKRLYLHVFAEDQLHASFMETLESWPDSFRSRFNYTVYSISFPIENGGEWKKLFKPCASQRLFLPLILKDIDSIVYVDSDILFLQPVDGLWDFLSQFSPSQLAAMSPEHEEPRIAWYSRFARHPFYGRTGINSGVMLMNMTRIRSTFFKNDMTRVGLRWEELLMPLLQKYKLNITWGDQDLLNIIFHHNPEFLLEFPCKWNYRPDHCIYGSNCASAEEDGVYVLHGNRGVYHDYKQPAFRAVYEAIKKYSFGSDPVLSLLDPLTEELLKTTHTYCGKSNALFTKRLALSLENINRKTPHGR
ncbi:glucoside xylosyltransferase 1 isoform X1 [Xiphophorus couchianus]|uniref:glucoside xylosyltransferase 1 isoform X1 n=1 Tax=Xiphophorus couchianus TaxID=32473 RepID=UPI00101676B2|nr:glucoside xylosyltransferase 1-like isoform X1 [Xiphophorus couchianus]XP_027899772.1 glucoside xylosyltransferase 1-like isoform X1 [Xiphophorus couchianus]